MTRGIDEEVLGLQVPVNVAEIVESVNGGKHLSDVEPGMVEVQDSRIIEQSPKITARNIFLFLPLEPLMQLTRDEGK